VTEATSRRVFFALWPDAAARDVLDALADQCAKQCGGRRVARENLHLTLAFIGPVAPERVDDLLAAAAKVKAPPFEMTLDRLGCWQHNRILWAGCSDVPPLELRLYSALALELAAAGFMLDARTHVPHFTLVRDAHCDCLRKHEIAVHWRVDTFSLVASSLQRGGAQYRALACWHLSQS
jgi:2'-5' RNA ligase